MKISFHLLAVTIVVFTSQAALSAPAWPPQPPLPPNPDMAYSPEYNPAYTSDPNARCRTSKLTQKKFLDMVHAIASHGDLTDKAFIEKTLQLEFAVFAVPPLAGIKLFPERRSYRAFMTDTIDVALEFDPRHRRWNEDTQGMYGVLSFSDIDRVGANFHDCKYLTRKEFDRKFGRNIHDEPAGNSRIYNAGKAGKNGTIIKISYSLARNSAYIRQIYLDQHTIEKTH